MIVLRDPQSVGEVADPYICKLVTLRFTQVMAGEPYDDDRHGYMVVVEVGDTVEQLEQEISLPILHGLFDDLPFDDPDFTPCFEILEEHQYEHRTIYEMVFISNDDGAATALFVPDQEGINADLLAMCRSCATLAVSTP